MKPVVITGLPRSRTAWFSAYLTQGHVLCYHEAAKDKLSLQPVVKYTHIGDSSSGYVLTPEWVEEQPEHNIVVIHRPIDDVIESLAYLGVHDVRSHLQDMNDKLNALKALHVPWSRIDEMLPEIHEHIGVEYEPRRAAMFTNYNIQFQFEEDT